MTTVAPAPMVTPIARNWRIDLVSVIAAVLLLLVLALFVGWPALVLVVASVTGPAGITLVHYTELFRSWPFVRLVIDTIVIAAVSTVLTVGLALVPAYAVTRLDIRGKRLVSLIGVLPLISPPFLGAIALVLLFGIDGVVTRGLDLAWRIYGGHGIVAAQVVTFLPHAYLLLVRALGGIDAELEEAAESLGAGHLTAVRRVTLSLAHPGIASATLLVFLLCLADFANPLLLGGDVRVLATEIYAQVIDGRHIGAAAAASVVLTLACLVAYVADRCWLGTRPSVSVRASARVAHRAPSAALRWPLFTASTGVALFVLSMHALVPLASFVRAWGGEWSPSLRHYADALTADGGWPIWNSLTLAVGAGLIGTGLVLTAAYVVERTRPPGARAITWLSLLPAALPGIAVGVAYLLAFDRMPLPLTGTMWALVTAVVFWKLPLAFVAASDRFRRIDPLIEEAAVGLGAGRLRAFARILLPLLTGTAWSVFIYLFVNGMVTVSAVILLLYPGVDLASVAIVRHAGSGSLGAACALATIVLALTAAVAVVLRRLVGAEPIAAFTA